MAGGLECASCYPGGLADWANCSWTQQCGAGDPRFQTDPNYRKQNAGTRHLGGSNLGFADGHAAWMNAEAILFGGEKWSSYIPQDEPILLGVGTCGFGPPNSRQ